MKKFLAVFVAVFFVTLPARADIMWAFVGPLTGSAASYGTMALVGVQQAVDDINQAGGVNGQKITLKSYDDVCDPKQAVAVANRIVADNIHLVMQGDCSGASIASAKVFIEENTVVINSIASNPKYTDEGGPTIFRTMYRDDYAAPVLSEAILKRFPNRRLAIIHDKSAYGFGIAEDMRQRLNKAGVKEVLFDTYDPNNRDFSALITHLKQVGAEVLFVGGYPVEAATIARQMHEANLKMQLVVGDLSDSDFWKIAQEAGEGSLFVFPPDPRKNKNTANLRAEFEKKNQVYNGLSLYAYASAQVLAQAMGVGPDPVKIADAIHQRTFDTILGPWHFDQKGDVQNVPLILYRWHNGQYEEAGP